VGVSDSDNRQIADKMTDKMTKLRIFDDADGKTNLSISDVGGEFLVISQFTLYADCRKGNRPSFTLAGKPDMAEELYEYIMEAIQEKGFPVARGEFGAIKHLLKSYHKQIKCIYIDPPYNTGTDGFTYNDKFNFTVDENQTNLIE